MCVCVYVCMVCAWCVCVCVCACVRGVPSPNNILCQTVQNSFVKAIIEHKKAGETRGGCTKLLCMYF